MPKKNKINALPINENDRTDPGPLTNADGTKISMNLYRAARQGQTDLEYQAMLRRMPPEAFGGLRGDPYFGSEYYLHVDMRK